MMTTPLYLVAAVVAALVILNIVIRKPAGSTTQSTEPALIGNPFQQLSIRQQQADEAAAAVATYFRKADEEAWVDEQLERAQSYLSSRSQLGKSSPASKS